MVQDLSWNFSKMQIKSFWFRTGSKIYWRRFKNGSRIIHYGKRTLTINHFHGRNWFHRKVTFISPSIGWLSWYLVPVWSLAGVVTQKSSVQCWNYWISWMVSNHNRILKLSWPQTESISWIQPYFDQEELTEKLNFQLQMKMWVFSIKIAISRPVRPLRARYRSSDQFLIWSFLGPCGHFENPFQKNEFDSWYQPSQNCRKNDWCLWCRIQGNIFITRLFLSFFLF